MLMPLGHQSSKHVKISRSSTENSRPYAYYFRTVCILRYAKKLTYFHYALGGMHCNREAIAAYTNYYNVQMNNSFQASINSSIDSALTSGAKSPRFNSQPGQLDSYKEVHLSFHK